MLLKGTQNLHKICTNTSGNRNTHANADTVHEILPVDDEYKKPSIDSLCKCVPHILCLQNNFVNYPSLPQVGTSFCVFQIWHFLFDWSYMLISICWTSYLIFHVWKFMRCILYLFFAVSNQPCLFCVDVWCDRFPLNMDCPGCQSLRGRLISLIFSILCLISKIRYMIFGNGSSIFWS